ncbi:MAG: molybdate ABC transporter substrate-binding protein [Anaerolineales bacterium]|jgi:molybdate transport system substrate-binding protein
MKRTLIPILTLSFLSACASNALQPAPVTLTVFAAASLTESFSEIATAFEVSHPGVNVSLNFTGSNTLRAQIEQGAQADAFASANTREMEILVKNGLIEDAPQIFLTNQLVIITPENNPAGLSTFDDLAQPDLKLVLAAEEVPVGRYTRLMLENVGADFKEQVLVNVVSNESNVKQVVAKVQLGEADAGIVYASDAVAAPELPVIEIQPELNVLAEYPIAALKDAPQPELADEFVAFVLSPEGQAVLQKWGFSTP